MRRHSVRWTLGAFLMTFAFACGFEESPRVDLYRGAVRIAVRTALRFAPPAGVTPDPAPALEVARSKPMPVRTAAATPSRPALAPVMPSAVAPRRAARPAVRPVVARIAVETPVVIEAPILAESTAKPPCKLRSARIETLPPPDSSEPAFEAEPVAAPAEFDRATAFGSLVGS